MSETKEKKKMLKINALGHAMSDSYMFIIPLLLPLFRAEFAINYIQSGLILTAHVAIRTVFSLLFGYFGDQYDKRWLIAGGFLFSSIVLGGLIWAQKIHIIVTLLLLLAIGVSTYHPIATSLVRENSEVKERVRNYSIFGAIGVVGAISSSLLFGIFSHLWGWKITLLLFSLPGYFLAYAYLRRKNGKKYHKLDVEKKKGSGYLPLFYIGKSFRTLGTWAILAFLPVYATDYIGFKPEFSAWMISIYFIGELLGTYIFSKIKDNGQQLEMIIGSTVLITVLIWAITLFMQPFAIILVIAAIGIVQGIFFPSQNVWLTYVCPVNNQSSVFGMALFSDGISATFAPAIYGWIAEQSSLAGAYRIASLPVVISFFIHVLLYILLNRQEKSIKI